MGSTLTGVPLYTQKGYEPRMRFAVPLPNGESLPIVRMVKIANSTCQRGPETIETGASTMTQIPQSDLIESIRAALQYISFYHPVDIHHQPGAGL